MIERFMLDSKLFPFCNMSATLAAYEDFYYYNIEFN